MACESISSVRIGKEKHLGESGKALPFFLCCLRELYFAVRETLHSKLAPAFEWFSKRFDSSDASSLRVGTEGLPDRGLRLAEARTACAGGAAQPCAFRDGLARLGRRFTKRCALLMPENKASRREGSPGRLSFGVEATLGCEGNSSNRSGRQPCSSSVNLACLLQQLRGNELFQRRTLPPTLFASARLPCCARRQQTTCRFPSIVESTTTFEGPDSGSSSCASPGSP